MAHSSEHWIRPVEDVLSILLAMLTASPIKESVVLREFVRMVSRRHPELSVELGHRRIYDSLTPWISRADYVRHDGSAVDADAHLDGSHGRVILVDDDSGSGFDDFESKVGHNSVMLWLFGRQIGHAHVG